MMEARGGAGGGGGGQRERERETEQMRETPKGSGSILVSEVESGGGRQWQPPGEAAVYSPELRP